MYRAAEKNDDNEEGVQTGAIFEKIKDCHPPQLVFDLHGFTVCSAIEYVYEIFDAMKQKIVFITGKGYRSETKARRIQAALLRTFHDTWQDEHNSGRIVMHFIKRLTYADALEDILNEFLIEFSLFAELDCTIPHKLNKKTTF
ncbi:unnamed protein product [Caenorhabditis brenneri]